MTEATGHNAARLWLRVENLGRAYDQRPVFADLSFCLGSGETLAVIGPSGCGKSTLLRLLAGLDKPNQGTLSMPDGVKTAFIPQDHGLFPWKTAAQNVALPLLLHAEPKEARQRATALMLAELGLRGLENRYPAALSGGQRQRVAIGRALITNPDILLMDEPFSSLDAIAREHLQKTVFDLWRQRRLTCILVTHSVAEAFFLGQHILVLGADKAGAAQEQPEQTQPEQAGPAQARLWLDNPFFGDRACRAHPQYATLTDQVYALLERYGADMSGDFPEPAPCCAEGGLA